MNRVWADPLNGLVQTRGERAVFRCIRNTPDISRVELHERTELTSAAVTQIVKRLISSRLAGEIPARNGMAGNIGRTRIGLAPVESAYFSLGIVIRRHDVQLRLVAPSGKVVHAWRHAHPTAQVLNDMFDEAMRRSDEPIPIVALGVGLPTFGVPWPRPRTSWSWWRVVLSVRCIPTTTAAMRRWRKTDLWKTRSPSGSFTCSSGRGLAASRFTAKALSRPPSRALRPGTWGLMRTATRASAATADVWSW
jgi:hypothetical protein